MSEYIPLEIQEEILKRLPVKPLIQFRSVSKPWKCLIDSPDFVVSYGVRHPPQPPDRFILRYVDPPSENKSSTFVDKYITLVDNDDDDHSIVQQEFIPKVPDLIKKLEPHSIRVVGSSHGLLCVNGCFDESSDGDIFNYDVTEMVILWNPSISKSVGIQVPCIYDSPNENFGIVGFENVIGFGVCPVTFDPTVLKITCMHYKQKMKDMPGTSVPWKVRVFTLSTGTWSILSTNLPREPIRLIGDQVVIDRFIYWFAFYMLDAEDGLSQLRALIMSFDLTTKEFKEINFPDSLSDRFCRTQSISKLRESLVGLEYHTEFQEDLSVCSLWIMKEQGVNRSFTMLYNINMPNPKINRILGFRKTRELIMETQQPNAEVHIYDPNSGAVDNLEIGGKAYSLFMCSYMETLLLVDQLDGFIYSIRN